MGAFGRVTKGETVSGTWARRGLSGLCCQIRLVTKEGIAYVRNSCLLGHFNFAKIGCLMQYAH